MSRTLKHGSHLYAHFGCRCDVCVAVKREENRKYSLVHPEAKRESDRKYRLAHPEYGAWRNAKARCFDPNKANWKNYGGRGITMAQEWINDFPAFLAHIGPRPGPGYTVDRIDNERGYEPGNVRWATRSEQARNKRPRTGSEPK